MSGFGVSMFAQHAQMLAASGITPEHADARGYRSIDTKARLEVVGFTPAGRRVPGLLVPSLGADGSVWGFQYRPDSPRSNAQGKPVKYETPVGQRNGIDVPPGVGPKLGDPTVPLWITEGAKKADSGALAGLCIVDLPGVWSWLGKNAQGGKTALPEWRDIALNGRRVILAFDGDVSRKRSVRKALDELAAYLAAKGAHVEYLHLPDEDDKVGLDDYLVAGHTVDDLWALARPAPPAVSGEAADSAGRAGRGPSAAAHLTRLAQQRYTFGVSDTGEPFALPLDGPRIVRMLRGAGGTNSLRAELAAAFLAEHGTPPPQQALADALLALEGVAQASHPQSLALRVGESDGALWLDLGDDTGDVVKIAPDGWEFVSQAPILHRRTVLTAPLPRPSTTGSVDHLWTLLNVAPADRPVLLGYLVAALLPNIPHPILLLTGEQGTGKSTAARVISSVVDPSAVQLRKPPRDLESWTTAAAGSHVVAVDNLSGLPDWFSDALCRASTGDGDVRRLLYANGDLYVIAFRRVVILNGIDIGAVRDDLSDRLVTVDLNRIHDRRRQRDTDLTERSGRVAPLILGGLLDLASQVLAILPDVRLERSPRMADFAHVLAAVDRINGTDGMGRYRQLAGELASDAVTSDPVLAALTSTVTEPWEGAAAQLLEKLTASLGGARPPKDWPSARSLAGLLKRKAPSLRRVGWTVEQTGEHTRKGVRWRLVPPAKSGDGTGDEDVSGDETCDETGDDRGDETVTNGDEGCSSPARHRFRHPADPPLTCEDAKRAPKGDEVTRNPSNLSFLLESKEQERENNTAKRDGPDFSSPRHPDGPDFSSPRHPDGTTPANTCPASSTTSAASARRANDSSASAPHAWTPSSTAGSSRGARHDDRRRGPRASAPRAGRARPRHALPGPAPGPLDQRERRGPGVGGERVRDPRLPGDRGMRRGRRRARRALRGLGRGRPDAGTAQETGEQPSRRATVPSREPRRSRVRERVDKAESRQSPRGVGARTSPRPHRRGPLSGE